MAGSINVNRARKTLASAEFVTSAVLVVLGSLLAQMATNWLRSNVYDVQMKGGDAVYALVAAMLALTVLPKKYGRPIALGSTASAVRVVADDFDLL